MSKQKNMMEQKLIIIVPFFLPQADNCYPSVACSVCFISIR